LEFDEKISVLDLNSGCTGFVDALRIACHFPEKTLIVCAENYSKNMFSFNRTVSPIFSDAAAVIHFDPAEWAVREFDSRVDASGWDAISCQHNGELQMDGRRVFEFVNSVATPLIRDVISRHDVDHIFLHQGSVLVLEHIIKKLRDTHSNIPINVGDCGNLVSATIPKLMQDTLGTHINVTPGTKLLLASFGVGLATSLLLLERQ
jgi:3-oxoacyl-[acyl-carrier-protein] synthase-3